MRILHFYKSSFPSSVGGVEQAIHQLAKSCADLNLNIDVLSLTSQKNLRTVEINGYLNHYAKLDLQIASTGFSLSALLKFSQLAKKADIIHYHFPWPFMDLVHFVTRTKKPTVVTYHSDIIRQKNLYKIYKPLQTRFLNDIDHIVATSPNYLKTSEVLDKYKNKVSVIPIGLDKDTYVTPSLKKVSYLRNIFGPKFFLFIGVLRYYKGLHILIEAAKGSRYPIVIVGSGPIEEELKLQVKNLGITNIYFLGHLSDEDKAALILLSYCIVFPSNLRSEAFGISLLEASMFGKPMISSEIGTGTSFININNETGICVPPSDPHALRQAMDYLWNHPETATEMGHNSRARFLKLFTSDKMCQKYLELYQRLILKKTSN